MNKNNLICYGLKASWHTISRMYNSLSKQNDVSISVGYVLLNLSKDKGVPSTSIAPMLGMEPNSLTRLIKSMEKEGWIKKIVNPEDKRQVNIFLTSDGYKKRNNVCKTIQEYNHLLKANIKEEELETFKRVLQKITIITEQNFKTA